MITPTVGRVVWVRAPKADQPLAAIITYVHSASCVNLAAFGRAGDLRAMQSVHLKQNADETPPMPYAEWMPYQKGQAAKTEALELAGVAHALPSTY